MRSNGTRSSAKDIGQRPFIHRQRRVRVGGHRAMPGKVFAGGGHAGLGHAVHGGVRQVRHRLRVGMKRPVADHLAYAAVEIEHRRKAEIHAHGAQLGGQEPAAGLGQPLGAPRVFVVELAQAAHRRQQRETLAETLHPPAFVVHRHQQPRLTQTVDFADQRGDLLREIHSCG